MLKRKLAGYSTDREGKDPKQIKRDALAAQTAKAQAEKINAKTAAPLSVFWAACAAANSTK